MFGDEAIMSKCFNSLILPCLEYRSPVWSPTADSHLTLLERFISSAKFLLPNLRIDLWHRHRVSSLCLLHNINYNNKHPLCSFLPDLANLLIIPGELLLLIVFHFLQSDLILCSTPGVLFRPQLRCGMACLVLLWSLLISKMF